MVMSFDQHNSILVLDMMRDMSFLPGFRLGWRQHGSSEFVTKVDHDTSFGLGFVPTESDYRYMAFLRKKRLIARLLHVPFDHPIRPCKMSLAYYFMRAPEGAAYMVDGSRWKPILGADQYGSTKEVLCFRPWSQDGWPSFQLATYLAIPFWHTDYF